MLVLWISSLLLLVSGRVTAAVRIRRRKRIYSGGRGLTAKNFYNDIYLPFYLLLLLVRMISFDFSFRMIVKFKFKLLIWPTLCKWDIAIATLSQLMLSVEVSYALYAMTLQLRLCLLCVCIVIDFKSTIAFKKLPCSSFKRNLFQ